MRWYTSNELRIGLHKKGKFVHRRFWLHDVPRLMLWCRLRGHRPVVDGHGPIAKGLHAARWVVCDRCGVRPDPQGNLDPEQWDIGQPYDGPWTPLTRDLAASAWTELLGLTQRPVHRDDARKPGRWPDKPTGTLGAELVLGKTFGVFSAEVTIGCAGDEHPISCHLRLWPFGALYLHTEAFGAWLQRRLIPDGYYSRVINISVDEWTIRWQWWAREDEWAREDPWWMHGRISLDLVEKLFGPKRYSYETVNGPTLGLVHMPDGDSHQVQLVLQRRRYGRPRRKRAAWSWVVKWTANSPGIETRPGKSGILSSAVEVPADTVQTGAWATLACGLIAHKLTADRIRNGYRPATTGQAE
ncbi:hypothetical protein ACIBKY_51035 [Nonomuraea sp. NPDC050394]|uniref:hypothetical protein n=1 Tax=Nonomuraea sp. NPDC050394 TaxID=3364363 RepID=UPI003793B215